MHMTRKWFWVDSTCPIHALIKTQRTQKADSRVQRGCTRGVGSLTGESSGPWTASLTAMKSLTTSCVFEESMPIPNNVRSEEHTSELQSHLNLVCRLLLE